MGLQRMRYKISKMEKTEHLERIVTIVSYEEFSDLVVKTGNDELTTMELIDAIAQINGIIYEATNVFGAS